MRKLRHYIIPIILSVLLLAASGWAQTWQKPYKGIQLNKTHPLAKWLLAAWAMNENGGNTVFDSSGHGNNLSFSSGTTWDRDGVNCSANTSKLYSVAGNGIVDQNEGSVVFRYKRIQSLTRYDSFFNVENATNNSPHEMLAAINFPGGIDALYFYPNVDQSSGAYVRVDVTPSDTVFPTTSFVQVAIVWKNGSTLKIYIDGRDASVNSGVYAWTASAWVNSEQFFIGLQADTFPAGGIFKHFFVFNKCLSINSINQLAVEPYAMFESRRSAGIFGFATAGGTVFMHPIRRFLGDGY